jgi:hypothetical protein
MTTANFGTTSINGRTSLCSQEINIFVKSLSERYSEDNKTIFDGSAYEYRTYYQIVRHEHYPVGITSIAPN